MGKYFGTDGFRGEATVTLTSEHAYKIGNKKGGDREKSYRGRCNAERKKNGDSATDRKPYAKD